MNLEVLKDYLSFLATTQIDLEESRNTLDLANINSFSFYKLIATKSQPEINHQLILAFIKSFTYNFQVKQPHQIINKPNYEMFPAQENSSQDQLMAKGIDLFINKWSNSNQINFQQFSQFLKGEIQYPQKAQQLEFSTKKQFYQLVQDQIQNLLDGDTFRKTVALHYKNLVDLFQVLSNQNKITLQQIKNLFLMNGERRNELFYQKIALRFPLPMEFSQFKNWFSLTVNRNKYKPQTKIYYSSIKQKKYSFHYEDNQNGKFMTPNGKTTAAAAAAMSSTKMTKAQRLNSIRRQNVEVSRFVLDQCPQTGDHKDSVILADILSEQQRVNQMKRQLLYQQNYDLQLIYERKGKQFEQILNNRYGTCNYTSFIRFIVPQDYDHKYYAFIKYNKENSLSVETNELVENIIDEEIRKQSRIKKWWDDVDRQIIFRSYCNPGAKGIKMKDMKKYFTERECKILLDRLDPNKTGNISLQYFK